MNIVKVTWRDARLYTGEITDAGLQDLCTPVYETVGFMLPDSIDGDTVIACERDDTGGWRQVTLIPAGMRQEVEVLLADA